MLPSTFRVTILTLLFLSGIFSGCYRMQLDTAGLKEPVYFSSNAPKEYKRLASFSVQASAGWSIFGLVQVKKPDIVSLIRDEIARQNGNAVINLTIKSQTTFGDGALGFIALLGLIYQPRSIFISGTVVSLDETSALLQPRSIQLEQRRDNGLVVYSSDSPVTPHSEIIF